MPRRRFLKIPCPESATCGSAENIGCSAAMQPGREMSLGSWANAKPILMVTDPPYGVELDSEWRDRAGLNGHGPAEPSYMKHRTKGDTETTRHPRRLVGSVRAGPEPADRLRLACIEVHARGS